jgi:chromate transporter
MNPWVLYLLLLKATMTSFSGLASLPIIREDLVVQRQVLTDEQLNMAIVVSRTTPGPVGIHVVSVGYSVSGVSGAIAGWLAMCTPAFVVIPLIGYTARHVRHPRIRSITRAVVVASAALILSAAWPLGQDTLNGPLPMAIAIGSLGVLLVTRLDTLWVVVAASVAGLLGAFVSH